MKELSIEEKAKCYDEAIERAQSLKNKWIDEDGEDVAFMIFPELKENEDERVRKKIIEYMKTGTYNKDYIRYADRYSYEIWRKLMDNFKNIKDYHIGCNEVSDIVLNAIIDTFNWLEKGGDKNKVSKHVEAINEKKVDDANKVEPKDYNSIDPHFGKPADKEEPKFHEGELVVDNCGNVWKIEGIINQFYILECVEGGESRPTIEWVDKTFHLWNIHDAKDGDVLFHSDSASNGIFIFKEIIDKGFAKEIICYCDYDSEDHFCLGEHHTCCWTDAKILYPATKEQRDTLFAKMKEAGYEWDAEKKELKKIEQKTATIDIDKMVNDYANNKERGNEEFGKPVNCMIRAYRQGLTDAIATVMLEKQGKQKSLDYENINIQQKDFAPKSTLEAIKEEKVDNANKVEPKDYSSIDPHFFKTTDKVEPKFKIGDWITDGYLHCKISDVLDDRYIVDTKFGKRSAIPFKRENNYHLWSIQDAKDGDILIYNDSIFIFDEIYENDLIYYGIYEHNKFHNDKYYSFLDLNTININIIYPATKEQRDTLEKAMADAGYTFNFEKKELKKLGQSEVTKMSDQEEIAEIPFGAKDSELQEATYFIPKGFHAEIDDDKVVIKKGEKPTTWSEEDELSCFESALFTAFSDAWQSYLLGEEVNVKRWAKEQSKELLEAAKEELKGHNSAWSEEDEKRLKSCLNILRPKTPLGNVETINTKWLKSLKDRYTWKPSSIQMECLYDAIHHYQTNGYPASKLNELYEQMSNIYKL